MSNETKQHKWIVRLLKHLFWCSWNGHNKTLVKVMLIDGMATTYYCSACHKLFWKDGVGNLKKRDEE